LEVGVVDADKVVPSLLLFESQVIDKGTAETADLAVSFSSAIPSPLLSLDTDFSFRYLTRFASTPAS